MGNAEGSTIGTTFIAAIVLGGGTWLLAATYGVSREPIAAHERAEIVARLNSVLDPTLRGRDLRTTRVSVTDTALLGSSAPLDAFVLRDGGTPAAVVLSTVAPHGYNAAIRLLVGVTPTGTVTGVRVVQHRETARLGDAIDIGRSSWITQFDGRSLSTPARTLWSLREDDGRFDAIAGATVTSRALVAAVRNALIYFEQHGAELLSAPADDVGAQDDNVE